MLGLSIFTKLGRTVRKIRSENKTTTYWYFIGTDSVVDDDDEPVKKKRGAKTPEPEMILPTNQVAELIESLQFNAVDMYK